MCACLSQSKELQAVVEADAAQHAAQYAALQAALAAEAGTAAPPPSSLLCSFEQYMWLAALVVRAPTSCECACCRDA